jgi:hypothetical protein
MVTHRRRVSIPKQFIRVLHFIAFCYPHCPSHEPCQNAFSWACPDTVLPIFGQTLGLLTLSLERPGCLVLPAITVCPRSCIRASASCTPKGHRVLPHVGRTLTRRQHCWGVFTCRNARALNVMADSDISVYASHFLFSG